MEITPEARFITLCVHEPETLPPFQVERAAVAVRDWDAVVALADCNRVAPYVHQAIVREGIPVPAHVLGTLRGMSLIGLKHIMMLNVELARITGALALAGVPVMVLKGPVLARTIYPLPALRPYADLDVNVQAQHESIAVATLLEHGFHEESNRTDEARHAQAHVHDGADFHRQFVGEKTQAFVELHVELLQLGLQSMSEDARWQRAVPVPRLAGALMLCPEDQVVHLSVHVHKHGFERLIWLKDLDLLLRTYGATLNWDQVAAAAHQEGVCSSVWYSLSLASTLLGAPVPGNVLERLSPSPPVRMMYGFVWPRSGVANLQGHRRRRAVQFDAGDSWRGMLPNLVLMGHRRRRIRAIASTVLGR